LTFFAYTKKKTFDISGTKEKCFFFVVKSKISGVKCSCILSGAALCERPFAFLILVFLVYKAAGETNKQFPKMFVIVTFRMIQNWPKLLKLLAYINSKILKYKLEFGANEYSKHYIV
jgi:hypothetical protein